MLRSVGVQTKPSKRHIVVTQHSLVHDVPALWNKDIMGCFNMAFQGRALNLLGCSATRIRSTGLRRLRSEFEEGPGKVSFASTVI